MVGKRADALGRQPVCNVFDLCPGQAIDNAALTLVPVQKIEQLLALVRPLGNFITDVRPVETG